MTETAGWQPDPDELSEFDLYSEQSEVVLMGAAAYHGHAMAAVLAGLDPAAFYRPARETVWRALQELSTERKPMGPADVARWLTANNQYHPGVREIIQREMSNAASLDLAPGAAQSVADLWQRRKLIQVITRMRGDVLLRGKSASEALALARERLDHLDSEDDDPHAPMSWQQLGAEFDTAHDPDTPKVPLLHTPWPSLDEAIGGLAPGRMYVFGGRPGDGKSMAALNIAASSAAAKRHVLVFSQEMSTLEVTSRLHASGAKVDLREIMHGQLSFDSRDRIRYYRKQLGQISLRVHAQPAAWSYIKSTSRSQKHRRGLDVLIVDYLQLIRSDEPGRSREQEVATVSRELKQLARELECAVVVPAQLNRGPESRAEKRPMKSDLRDSGQIEQDADAVILLWPKLDDKGAVLNIKFIVDKNRHGPRAEIDLGWNGGYGEITDPLLTRSWT